MLSYLLLLWGVPVGLAEPAGVKTTMESVDDAIVPPVLLAQATLHYPEVAYPDLLHGTVVLKVHITHLGVVETVRIESGPEVFHEEARIAAKRLKFTPASREGVPIASDTLITFHFSPPHIEPRDDLDHPDHSIVVSSDSLHNQTAHVEELFSEEDVERERQIDLARSIEGVAGVEFASGSSNASKPIIRGQTERRLLIIRDGSPHASQKWSVDHAPEIDVFDIGTIRVRKGAEAVRYGGEAIGGVILIDSPELLSVNGFSSKTTLGSTSNGRKRFGMGRVDFKRDRWSGRVQGNWMDAMDIQTPDYILGNTASNILNLGGVIQHDNNRSLFTVRMSHYHNHSGVFYGMRAESPDDLANTFTSEQPLNASDWRQGRDIDKPYQEVDHSKGSIVWDFEPTWGSIQAHYTYQHNDRREAEPSRIPDALPQYNFLLRTHSAEIYVDHADWIVGTAELDVEWGLNSKLQDNLYSGRTLIPNYRQLDLGAFWTQRMIFERTSVSMGVRLDGSHQDAFMTDDDYDAHERRDLLPEDCTMNDRVAQCTTQYTGNAFVLGGIWQVVPEAFELRGDISTGARFPNVDERYILGAAPTFPVYAMGDPNLPREQVRSGTLTMGYRNAVFSTEISGYANLIDNYIYFAPWTVDGSLQNVTLSNGSFPIYKFQSVNAYFYGLDGTLQIMEESPLATTISGATVRAWNRDTSEHLVGIPPDSIRLKSGWTADSWAIQPSLVYTAKQHRVSSDLDFADPPEDFFLLNVQASLKHQYRSSEWVWNLNVQNILNTRYRRYTSLLRYYADEPGRDVQISVSTTF